MKEVDDPLGHELLKKRISQCTSIIESMMEVPDIPMMPNIPQEIVVTGVGSSEAHARFFINSINEYTPARAWFRPLSSFYTPMLEMKPQATLVVISQGMSPNSMLALNQRGAFGQTVLFTAARKDASIEFDKKEKAEMLQALNIEGQTVVPYPIEDEYGLLMRTIGPMACYVAILQFIGAHWRNSLPPCNQSQLLSLTGEAAEKVEKKDIKKIIKDLNKGSVILCNYPISDYAMNLAYKVMEGLYMPMPVVVDFLAFAHGTFQELVKSPKPVFILSNKTRADESLVKHTMKLIKHAKAPHWHIEVDSPDPHSILEFEAIFNEFLVHAVEALEPDQKNWPGKGKDSDLYNLKEPLS